MSKAETGGPAFPLSDPYRDSGMTLRDWFAGQALAGLLSDAAHERPLTDTDYTARKRKYAIAAYDLADEMIAARFA